MSTWDGQSRRIKDDPIRIEQLIIFISTSECEIGKQSMMEMNLKSSLNELVDTGESNNKQQHAQSF